MASKYSTEQDEEAPVETREDAMQVARMLMDRENFFCAEFALKKIKKVDGTIKVRLPACLPAYLPSERAEKGGVGGSRAPMLPHTISVRQYLVNAGCAAGWL